MVTLPSKANTKPHLKTATLKTDCQTCWAWRNPVKPPPRWGVFQKTLAGLQMPPTLKKPHPYRLPGTLKKSIITKASKRYNGRDGEIGVYLAVRKRKGLGGKASARNPFDPFYWRFQEFGTKKQPARKFLTQAFESNAQKAIDIFQARVKTHIDKANARRS